MFECKRCGFKTPQKQTLMRHLMRKNPCCTIKSDCSCEEQLKGLEKKYKEQTFDCDFCGKRFNYAASKSKHKRKCEKRPLQTVESLTKAIDLLNDKLEKLDVSRNLPPVLNTNCNNQTINIQINAFGNESTDHLSHTFLTKCIKRTNQGLVQLLEKLHFDDEKKENANVRILNKKEPLAEIKNKDGKWQYVRRESVLNEMVDRGQEILQEHFDDNQDEIKETVSDSMFEYIIDWFHKMEDKDKSVLSDVLTDIYIMLLNKSRDLSLA